MEAWGGRRATAPPPLACRLEEESINPGAVFGCRMAEQYVKRGGHEVEDVVTALRAVKRSWRTR